MPVLAAGSYWLSFSAPTGDIAWAYADPAAIAGADGFDYIGYAEVVRPKALLPARYGFLHRSRFVRLRNRGR